MSRLRVWRSKENSFSDGKDQASHKFSIANGRKESGRHNFMPHGTSSFLPYPVALPANKPSSVIPVFILIFVIIRDATSNFLPP